MKTPWWEQSPGALVALINTGQFVYAHCYTIVLSGGAGTLRFTDGDLNITNGTLTWDSRGIRVDQQNSKTLAHWKRGLDLDTWLLIVLPRYLNEITGDLFPDKINNVPWIQACRQGALDGADVQVDRAYFSAWPQPYQLTATPVGLLTIFAGTPAEVDTNDTIVAVTLNDYRELLGMKMPRQNFQSGCRHTLFDAGCGIAAAGFVQHGTAIGGTTQTVIKSAAMAAGGSGTFQLGRLKFTSGNNANFSRTVSQWRSSAAGTFTLRNPFPFPIIAGDTFDVYPGCDKTQAACTLFANLINYGGFPFIPQAETAN